MSNLHQEIVVPDGSDLASRASALKIRHIVENVVNDGGKISVDLKNVLSISESYADELFAVLVEKNGVEWFSNNIKLLNHSPNLLRSIAVAIKRRSDKKELFNKASIDKLVLEKRKNNAYHTANYV